MSWSSAPVPEVAIAAAVLAGAQVSAVTVLERGAYHNESDFTHLESDAYGSMYLDSGLNSTADGGVLMLAGSTLGGGTVINYTTSFPTPDSVREEWGPHLRISGGVHRRGVRRIAYSRAGWAGSQPGAWRTLCS